MEKIKKDNKINKLKIKMLKTHNKPLNMKLKCLFFLFTFVFSFAMAQQTKMPKDKFVNELLSKMTLEEKLGQLNLPTSGDIITGQGQSVNVKDRIAKGEVGGLFNIKSVAKIKEMQEIALIKSRLKIPLIIAMDVIHGYETTFPIPLALSCTWDMNLIEKSARIAAQEATADGVNWTFSPMIDIARDPRWGRIAEGSGEDPFLGSAIARAMIKGYQGDNLAANNTMLACAKHFALYGAAEAGRDYNTVDMSRNQMYNVYFPPFKAAVESGVGTFMTAFNEVDGMPASGNKWLFTEVLRNQWKFKGFVVTDYEAIKEMTMHGTGDLQHNSALALNAGIEMDMVDEGFVQTLPKSLQEKKVTQKRIDEAVKMILSAKYDLGLFENPYIYLDEKRAKTEIFTPENRKVAREIATQSFVLLKNKENILPLQNNQKIALIGPLHNSKENMPGTWSVATDLSKAISLLQGLQDVVGNDVVMKTAFGSNLEANERLQNNATMFGRTIPRDTRPAQEIIDEALAIANQSDVIVAAVGESSEYSGESSSRTKITIPQVQKDLLNALYKTGKPVVIVLFTGRPLDLTEENEKATAILNVWFGGTETGHAIADVLYGKVNPSGKLTTTFPRNIGQVPIYYNHKNTGRPLSQGKTQNCEFDKFKSGFIDECNTPLFPFGFGLSYTTFEVSNLKLSAEKMKANEIVKASVTVTNTGNYEGSEVVQLYLHDKVGSIARPVKELKGFQKIMLKKGESKTVTFEITEELLKFYNYDLNYVSEPGAFDVYIGSDSSTKLKSTFELVK
jgi:beta-glucosidase